MSNNPAPSVMIQQIRHSSILPSRLNPRKDFNAAKLEEIKASIRQRGFDPKMSHLLVRPIPQELRVQCAHDLAEFAGNDKPYRIERKNDAGAWEVIVKDLTEDAAGEALVASARFELVAGERRWRAARDLDLEYVPVVVQEMTDREALENMMVENLQRADFLPLEEAEGYESLLALRDEEAKVIHTVKTIAACIGVTPAHVQQRLDLLILRNTPAAEALAEGTLNVTCARAIARIPVEAIRAEVAHKALNNANGVSPMPRQQLENMIRDEYQRDFRGAPFALNDAELLPVQTDGEGKRVMGGACTDCPFNSKNAGEKESRWPVCLNTLCFKAKEEAEYRQWMAANTERGRVALDPEEAAGLWDYTGNCLAPGTKYFDLALEPAAHDLRAGIEAGKKWKELLRGMEYVVYLVRGKNRETRELVLRDEAFDLAQKNGHDIFKRADRKAPKKPTDGEQDQAALAADRRRRQMAAEVEEETFRAVLEAVRGEKTLPDEAWPLAVGQLISNLADLDGLEPLATRRGWVQPKAAEMSDKNTAEAYMLASFKKTAEVHRFAFLIELCISTFPLR